MEIEYRRNLRQSYMIITLTQVDIQTEIGYQTEMCRRNKIPGFLEMETAVANGKIQFWYNITGRQSLEEYLKNYKLDYHLLKELIRTISRAITEIDNYLLEEDGLSLQSTLIFIGNADESVHLCYCRESGAALPEAFRNLMEYLLTKINHSDEKAVAVGYEIYQRTLADGYHIEQIWEPFEKMAIPARAVSSRSEQKTGEMQENETEKGLPEHKQAGQVWKNIFSRVAEKAAKYLRQESKRHLKKLPKQKKMQFKIPSGKTAAKIESRIYTPESVPSQEPAHPTVFLGEACQEKERVGVLIFQGVAEEKLILDKSPFVIGGKQGIEGRIEQSGVSRLHAKVTREAENYYLEDMNSTNGTRVNGVLLNYMEQVLLKEGDVIQFGEAAYVFRKL